MIRNRTL